MWLGSAGFEKGILNLLSGVADVRARTLHQKWTIDGTAVPPDVRRWLLPRRQRRPCLGYAPRSGFAPFDVIAPKAAPWAKPDSKLHVNGGAEPPPQIRRHSQIGHGSCLR